MRKRFADLITAFYEGDKEHLDAKIDCVMLYLTPTNQWHKDLVEQLGKMKRGEDTDLNVLIKTAQDVLRYNWWAVKTESLVSYEMDKERDAALRERKDRHKEDDQPAAELPKILFNEKRTGKSSVDMVLKVFLAQEKGAGGKEGE